MKFQNENVKKHENYYANHALKKFVVSISSMADICQKLDLIQHYIQLSLYLNNTTIQIVQANNNPVYGQLIDYNNLAEYQSYEKAYEKFYSSIVKKEYLSDYHPSVIEIDNIYKINNVCGYFDDYDD